MTKGKSNEQIDETSQLIVTRRSEVYNVAPRLSAFPDPKSKVWLNLETLRLRLKRLMSSLGEDQLGQGSLTEGEGSVQLTSLRGGRLSTIDLLVLTNLDKLVFILTILFSFFTKQVTLMRRSTVLSLFPQLVFPGWPIIKYQLGKVNLSGPTQPFH